MVFTSFKGSPVQTAGMLPVAGQEAPPFSLTRVDLSEATLETYAGKVKILSFVPSLDTSVCALSARRFNEAVVSMSGVVLLNISADLPFAQKRFCQSEKLSAVEPLSSFRAPGFGKAYGVLIQDGPLTGLLARAVLVVDRANRVVYSQGVSEITNEPDYFSALASAQAALFAPVS